MENPQTSHGRDGRIILLISCLLFFMDSTGMRSPICVPLHVSMLLNMCRASAGNWTAASRQYATLGATILDLYKLSDCVLPSDSSEARDEAGLVGGVFGSLRRSWVSRRSRRKLLRRSHLLPRHPADATPGSIP